MKNYNYFGAFIDCAGNGRLQVSQVKNLIDKLEIMEYNLLEICMNDAYEIPSEPYFGYLRGGSTQEELREIDAYAIKHGIELVPCIQTLAHLPNLVKLPTYYDIVDCDEILLIDEPKTYDLIEHMFQSLRACFHTNLVNISMDEAWKVGLGKYLQKHGYTNRFELILKHLRKVLEIANKYGFRAHMWSDMFFRLASDGIRYYVKGLHIPQEIIRKIPQDVGICYWDYGEHELTAEMYDELFCQHEELGRELWFAGGAWCWNGFAPHNKFALESMRLAMQQVIKHKVKNVLVTVWASDGNDCSYFSTLPSLYAIKEFAKGNFDMSRIKQGFEKDLELNFDNFMLLDLPNQTSRDPDGLKRENPCKSLLFNDCFVGWKDYDLSKVEPIPYGEYAKRIERVKANMGEYGYLFDNMVKLCQALELKADLGLRTRKAYREKNTQELNRIIEDYEETAKRVLAFRDSMYTVWMKENKPFGWEIQEIRFGGLYARILNCRERLLKYVQGGEQNIPELELDILPYGEMGLQYNIYRDLVTVSQL